MKLQMFKKADIVLAAILLILGLGGFFLPSNAKDAADTAVVSVDGKVIVRMSLGKDCEYPVSTEYGNNTVVVEGGSVYIKDSDCKGGDCVRLGKTNSQGKIIVCLPHHLTVTVEGGGDAPDSVVF